MRSPRRSRPRVRDARALAEHPTFRSHACICRRQLQAVRGALPRLARRQQVRRDEAHDDVTSSSHAALLTIGVAGFLALVGVLAFLTMLIRTMRRPLDDLVGAARRMSSGDLSARVEAGGPKELEAVGIAFNAMGADLSNASARLETQRQRLATTIQSLGDGLVMCDNNDRITSLNPRASELVADAARRRLRARPAQPPAAGLRCARARGHLAPRGRPRARGHGRAPRRT